MRQKLSINSSVDKWGLIILIVFCIGFVIYSGFNLFLTILFGLISSLLITIRILIQNNVIEFDSDNLYYQTRNSEGIIPLNKIKEVKQKFPLMRVDYCKIIYENEMGEIKVLRSEYDNYTFEIFEKVLNPNEIKQ